MTENTTLEAKLKALAETHIPAMTRFGHFAEYAPSDTDMFTVFGPVVDGRQAYVVIAVTAWERANTPDLDAMLLKKVEIANLVMNNNLREAGVEIAA